MKKYLHLCLMAGLLTGASAATLEEVIADSKLWPVEVVVPAMTKAAVLKNGQPAGMMLIGAGKKLVVINIAADGVTGKLSGTTVKVALDKTDLRQRLNGEAPAAPVEEAPADTAAAAEPARSDPAPTAIQTAFVGRLVKLQNGSLTPYDMRKLNGVKYYGIMFSAGWCGPCRAFAPQLLDSYRKLRTQYPEFELVLVSADHSPGDMLAYMRDEQMPWPAVKFSEIQSMRDITRLSGPGIPCLVLIDSSGKVLADSYKGGNYLGPASALEATWRILKKQRGG